MPAVSKTKQSEVARMYARFGPVIFGRARGILKDDSAAEDATQEVFMRLLPMLLAGASDLEAVRLARRAATNHCLNQLRRQQVRDRFNDFADTTCDGPEKALVAQDLAAKALSRVPPEQADAARLWLCEELSQTEVANALKVSRRTISTRLSAFMESARQTLSLEEAAFASNVR